MRKSIKVLLCTMICFSMLLTVVGCGSNKTAVNSTTNNTTSTGTAANGTAATNTVAKGPTGTIEFWSMLTQEERAKELQKLADNYMAEHPGTKINITVMPWSGALDKIVSAIMAGNAPDIMTTGSGWPQSLAATGGLLELSDLVDQIGGKDAFLSTSLTVQGAYGNGLYSIPLYITPYVAYYRKSWLDAAGIKKLPTTWEEYYDMCKAVTDPSKNRYGFGIPLGDLHSWKTIWSFLQADGVDLINVDQNNKWYVDVNDESRAAMVETYNYLYKLVKDCSPKGSISYTQENVREMVAGGVIMSRIDTPEIYYNVKKIAPNDINDFSYFKIPGRKTTGSGQGWVGLSISAKGNTDLSKDFVKYMFTGDKLVNFYLSYPYAMFPAKADLFKNQQYQTGLPNELKNMVPDMALDILSTSTNLVMANGPFPGAGEVESKMILGNALVMMLSKNATADQAVDYVISQLNDLVKNYNK